MDHPKLLTVQADFPQYCFILLSKKRKKTQARVKAGLLLSNYDVWVDLWCFLNPRLTQSLNYGGRCQPSVSFQSLHVPHVRYQILVFSRRACDVNDNECRRQVEHDDDDGEWIWDRKIGHLNKHIPPFRPYWKLSSAEWDLDVSLSPAKSSEWERERTVNTIQREGKWRTYLDRVSVWGGSRQETRKKTGLIKTSYIWATGTIRYIHIKDQDWRSELMPPAFLSLATTELIHTVITLFTQRKAHKVEQQKLVP